MNAPGSGSESVLHLERMTWPEVEAALSAGRRTAVFACGAVEQHGPHLPLFTDAEHGTRLSIEVAARLGDAIVAPTVRVGCSDHHMGFPGTLTLRPETFTAVVRDWCTSLARHGFARIAIIPSHGGNYAPLRAMLPELREAAGSACAVEAFTDLEGFIRIWRAAVEDVAGLGERVGGHADIAETSIVAVLHPGLVRGELAAEGLRAAATREFLDRMIREGFRAITPNGILGDARGFSAAIGERCIAAAADHLAEFFRTAFTAAAAQHD